MAHSAAELVLYNDLIMETICQYLSFPDLLNMCRVNKQIYTSVSHAKNFGERLFIRVFWNLNRPQDVIYPETKFTTSRNLKVMIMFEDKQQQYHKRVPIESILPTTKALKLTLLLQNVNLNSLHHGKIHAAGMKLLNSTPELKSFGINRVLMSMIDLTQLAQTSKNRIKFWKEIILYAPPTRKTSSSGMDQEIINSNIHLLSSNLKNLSRLVLDKIDLPTSSAVAFGKIIQNNSATLRTLEIILQSLPANAVGWLQPNFPLLKRLKLKSFDATTTADFLRRAPPLELLHLSYGPMFTKNVYDILGEKGSKLRSLYVKGKMFVGGVSGDIPNWDILSNMPFLQNLELRCPYSSGNMNIGRCTGIFANVGPNIQRIYLRGLENSARLNIESWNFPNLMELSLLRCKNALDDSSLNWISTNVYNTNEPAFPKLTTFEISVCEGITNAGLMNIAKRQNLKKLTIKQCRNITDKGLSYLSFPELRSLDISSNFKLQKAAVVKTVQNNPRLEYLRSSWRIGREVSGLRTERFIKLDCLEDMYGKEPNDSDSGAEQKYYQNDSSDDNYGYSD